MKAWRSVTTASLIQAGKAGTQEWLGLCKSLHVQRSVWLLARSEVVEQVYAAQWIFQHWLDELRLESLDRWSCSCFSAQRALHRATLREACCSAALALIVAVLAWQLHMAHI